MIPNVYAPSFKELSELAALLFRRRQYLMARKIALAAARVADEATYETWMLWLAFCAEERMYGRVAKLEEQLG